MDSFSVSQRLGAGATTEAGAQDSHKTQVPTPERSLLKDS